MANKAEEGGDKYSESSARHGFSVLNALAQDETTKRFFGECRLDHIQLEELELHDYRAAKELQMFTIKPKYLIGHMVGDKPGEFDGMYIAEEIHSLIHPLLLIPGNLVTKVQN